MSNIIETKGVGNNNESYEEISYEWFGTPMGYYHITRSEVSYLKLSLVT